MLLLFIFVVEDYPNVDVTEQIVFCFVVDFANTFARARPQIMDAGIREGMYRHLVCLGVE